MNIQEAKALALEAFKKELKEPGWETEGHGIAKGPWLAFPGKRTHTHRGQGPYFERTRVYFKTSLFYSRWDEEFAKEIVDCVKRTELASETEKDQQFIDHIQHYLSKHPLEAP